LASSSWSCAATFHLYCFGVDYNSPVTVTPTPGRIAFLSSKQVDPSKGMASADALCQSEATGAGLSGSYLALLSTSSASAVSRFSATGGTWVRPDGIPLVNQATDLLNFDPSRDVVAALNIAADKSYVLPSGDTWTGGDVFVWAGAQAP